MEQLGEGFGGGGRVVMQQPDPLGRGAGASRGRTRRRRPPGARALRPACTAAPMPLRAWSKTVTLAVAEGLFEEGRGMVAGTGINPDAGVRGPGLGRQRREGPGEKVTAVVGNHDGGDSYFLKN